MPSIDLCVMSDDGDDWADRIWGLVGDQRCAGQRDLQIYRRRGGGKLVVLVIITSSCGNRVF